MTSRAHQETLVPHPIGVEVVPVRIDAPSALGGVTAQAIGLLVAARARFHPLSRRFSVLQQPHGRRVVKGARLSVLGRYADSGVTVTAECFGGVAARTIRIARIRVRGMTGKEVPGVEVRRGWRGMTTLAEVLGVTARALQCLRGGGRTVIDPERGVMIGGTRISQKNAALGYGLG